MEPNATALRYLEEVLEGSELSAYRQKIEPAVLDLAKSWRGAIPDEATLKQTGNTSWRLEWTLFGVEVERIGLAYGNVVPTPILLHTDDHEVENDSSVEQEFAFEYNETLKDSLTWSVKVGLKAGVKVSVSGKPPIGGKAGMDVTLELSSEVGYSTTRNRRAPGSSPAR